MKPTKEQIEKLPKWAQEHIRHVEIERELAVRALNQFQDEQTESGIYFEEYVCTGEQPGPTRKRRYAQTNRIVVENYGVKLYVCALNDGRGIELKWEAMYGRISSQVAIVPTGFQQVELLAKEQMT